MDCLPENKILKYNPDTLVSLRKLYNLEKPGEMKQAIDILDAWIKKQNHFVKKDFSRDYLERIIIQLKGSVERSKGFMDKMCTLRTILPKYFEKCDAVNDFKILTDFAKNALIPSLTKENNRILFSKYEAQGYSPEVFFQIYGKFILMCEYLKANDYFSGLIVVSDLRGINIVDFVSQLNLFELKELCTIFLEGYDSRVQSFIFMSSSKTIDVLIKIFKQMISEKLGKRVHVVKDVEGLQKHISKDLLPSDYGGDESALDVLADKFENELGSEENIKHFKEMAKAQVIETLRISSVYNGDFSGLPGTFRALSVD